MGVPSHIYAYEGIVPAEILILQYIFPCPPFSINNDLSLIFHSFFLIGLFKIVIAMVVFSVVLLLLIGQFCQGIIIYIKFIVTKILIPIIPILAPSFVCFFLLPFSIYAPKTVGKLSYFRFYRDKSILNLF